MKMVLDILLGDKDTWIWLTVIFDGDLILLEFLN